MSERIVAVVWYAWVVLVSPARFVVKCTLVFRCVVTVGRQQDAEEFILCDGSVVDRAHVDLWCAVQG